MMTRPSIVDLAVEVPRREVLRSLGYPRDRRPSERVERALNDGFWDEAQHTLHPRGLYRFISGETAAETAMPAPTSFVGLGLCTIGSELEEEVARLSQSGQMLEALLLDAFGSAAAEAAAEALNVLLCREAQGMGQGLLPRISPGYGRWPIDGQKNLLPLLEAERIGIRLTDGLMMVPRKSVSFAVRLEAGPASDRKHPRRCDLCDLAQCVFRSAPEDDES
jgi:hypothetical protein